MQYVIATIAAMVFFYGVYAAIRDAKGEKQDLVYKALIDKINLLESNLNILTNLFIHIYNDKLPETMDGEEEAEVLYKPDTPTNITKTSGIDWFIPTYNHINQSVAMTYRNSKGVEKDRTIDIKQIGKHVDVARTLYFYGYCNSARRTKMFVATNIISFIQPDTGEVISKRIVSQLRKFCIEHGSKA